jgi:hypothetical protein
MLWENGHEYVMCGVFFCLSSPVSPAAGGSPPRFIDQGGSGLHARARYLAMWRGATCCGVEWAAVRTIPATIWSSWPDLYPNSGGSRVGERRIVVASPDRLRGRC